MISERQNILTVGTKNEETRHAWVAQKLADLSPGSRILDAGAGEQPYRQFCSHLRYVSQDFAQYESTVSNTGLQMAKWDYGRLDIICDITAIPEPDGSFDAVMCLEVLEHVADPLSVIHELSRLVRKGRRLIASAPVCSLTHFAPYHFSTGFSRFFYEKHLPENGFRVLEVTPNGNYFEYLAQELRRLEDVAMKYGRMRPGRLERGAITRLLKMLQRFSSHASGSDELLAFGFQVIAEKER